MAIKPQTTAQEIQTALNALIEPGRFVPRDSEQVVSLLDSLDQLAKVDEDTAHALRALVIHMTGDFDGALAIDEQRQGNDPINRLVILSNYGRAAEARDLYIKHCGPHGGFFTRTVSYGIACGAFHAIADFARLAQKMHIDKLDQIGLDKILMSDKLLTEFGISDEESGRLMETAGTVLVDHGFMFLGDGPQIDVIDVPGELQTVHVTYRIATTASSAIDIYMDFIARLMDKGQTIPSGMHISFEGIA